MSLEQSSSEVPAAGASPPAQPALSPQPALFVDLGRMAYQEAWDLQRAINERQVAGTLGHVLLFVEHPPTITIGRRGKHEEVLAPKAVLERRGIAVTETDRGGEITYHGPGQIVAYPLVNIQQLGFGVHAFMRAMEEAVIQYTASLGLKGFRWEGRTGVWIGKDKACAMGIRVRKWWTLHGLALNVRTDLNHFGMIVPCGIRDRGVTSLERLMGEKCPDFEQAKDGLKEHLARELRLDLTNSTVDALQQPG
ncbi:MAG: lipoyl(octanoyl) transferase [Candidatus Sumerlaeota bacterium]|nr:lipoyl(octanoyl) transferase [Candidatus Sumerlaeota bacterium]